MTTSFNPAAPARAAGAPTAAPAPPSPPASPVTKPHLGTLLVVLTGTFMGGLDFFIVNVAIPSMQIDLTASAAAMQFVIAGYALAFGSGMILGGRLGDIYGRRRVFIAAMAVFTLASAVCGVAPNVELLIAARLLQGAAAAVMSPQVLTILGTTYSGEARARAINAYGMAMGISAVFGQLIGGLLIKGDVFGLGWRACFLINIPIGLVAILLAPRWVPESRAPGRPRLDIVGTLIVTAALVAVVLPLIEGREQGWPLWSWLLLAAAVPLFALFAVYERAAARRGASPLIDLSLFRERAFTAGLLAQVVFWTGQASFFLVFAIYVQQGRGLDALEAGLIFVAIGGGYMATSMTARHVAARLGRQVIALGGVLRMIALTAMVIILYAASSDVSLGWLIPALILDGAGMGLAVAPLAATVISRITPAHAGSATGVLTTGVQIGNALGVALIGVIFYDIIGDGADLETFTDAFRTSLFFLIGIGAALALLVQLLPRVPRGAGGR
ncbi:MFS transporter [Frankia sp. Cpl3]|nr:MFS transporter [Parafrankia colletiae]MCK9902316.1 MFS transporter [Frankia sp. Cpl3]